MKNYLSAIGLKLNVTQTPHTIVNDVLSAQVPVFNEAEIEALYHYVVPEVAEEGCGLKAKDPYRLEQTLGLEAADLTAHKNTSRLYQLNQVVQKLQALTGVDWLGIYRQTKNQAGDLVLLKEAYLGRFSRAEFPLTPEFAKQSNNSSVGLSKKAIVVQSVEDYAGPYYTCDTAVQSEFCLPILSPEGALIGIIDAEAFAPHFFTDQRLLEITKVAQDLGASKLLDFEVDERL